MRLLNTILDILFPAKCVSCGEKGIDLCLSCLKDSPGAIRETAKWIFPVYDYRHIAIKKALRSFKYKNKRNLAKIFAEILYEKITEELSELEVLENFRNPILIPIPLSSRRRRERGYNQTELLCEEILKLDQKTDGLNLVYDKNILFKPKETIHQAEIGKRSIRLQNIRGSFAIKNEKIIKNRNIILLDDITTTGATLNEAKKILKDASAKKIIAFTVAH